MNYREAYDMYACNGILFNHESPIRGETFVTRKITIAITRIHEGLQDCLYVGNLDAKRDWGHARDYVEMQWMMLQQDKPKDYVIATGKQYSVRDFINAVCKRLNMEIEWKGSGEQEKAYFEKKCIVQVDSDYYRPCEVETLLGDASMAHKELGWKPRISFNQLVDEMVESDLRIAQKEKKIL